MKIAALVLIFTIVKCENLQSGSKCDTFDSNEGVCVNIRECKVLENQLRNGSMKTDQVKICNDVTRFVCCPTASSSSSVDSRSSWDLSEASSNTCGKPVIGFGTVFYGTQIKRGAYPWLAALIEVQTDKLFCGGSLVSKTYVVTAAHCIEGKQGSHVFRPKDILVILGGHNLEARNEAGRTTASVKDIYVHHEWNPNLVTYDADIAIVKLAEQVTYSSYIQPICIAAPKSEAAAITEGVVVGFGKSERNRIENIARVITSPIHSYQVCASSASHETLLTHRTFCGGFPNGTNVCQGDSGGGLLVKHNGIYYLRGIVSASLYDSLIGCNIDSYSIYTDVLEFHSWLTSEKDEKILLQTTLEENRKLLLNITRCRQSSTNQEILLKNLKEENQKLKAHTTTESPSPSTSNEFLSFQPKSTKFVNALCNDMSKKPLESETSTQAERAEVAEFPFHVALGYESTSYNPSNPNKIDYRCGGSLIADDIVLTSAHCVARKVDRPIIVKLGRVSVVPDDKDFEVGEDIDIQNITIHPNYTAVIKQNDIALIKLKMPTNFSRSIKTACLSSSDENLPVNFTVVGFGRFRQDSFQTSDWLMKANYYIYPFEQCEAFLETYRQKIISKQFCAMHYDGEICAGSGGGSLSYKSESGSHVYGIISYGLSCGQPFPSILTKVNQFLEWIDEEMYNFEKN